MAEIPIPPVLTVTAVSTIEATVTGEELSEDSWTVIETSEQGRLLLNLPGPMYYAMEQATRLAPDLPGPGRLILTGQEIAAYRAHIAQLTSGA